MRTGVSPKRIATGKFWIVPASYAAVPFVSSGNMLPRWPPAHLHIRLLTTKQQRNLYFFFLRKEVIQPHLPIRLPCYDFTPVTGPAFGSSLPLLNTTLYWKMLCIFLRKILVFVSQCSLLAYKIFFSEKSSLVMLTRGWVTDFGHYQLPWCDGRCVQDPGTYSPRHSDSRLLAIPASCSRVADYNPNWDVIFEICSASQLRFSLFTPL